MSDALKPKKRIPRKAFPIATPPVDVTAASPATIAVATAAEPVVDPVEVAPADASPASAEQTPQTVPAPSEPVDHADPVALTVSADPAEPTDMETDMNDTVNKFADTAKQAGDETVARLESGAAEFNERAQGAMERGSRLVEEMNDFSKGNLEAMVESSKAAARHAEAFGQHAVELSRKNYEQVSAMMQQFASIKSPTDFFRLQSDYARQAFDQAVAETSRNSELALKAAGEVFQPLSNRLAVAAEKIKVVA